MPPYHQQVLDQYQGFVASTLNTYLVSFKDLTVEQVRAGLFDKYWKPFFDELVGEANRIFKSQEKEISDAENFKSYLQNIAERGLVDFKQRTDQLERTHQKSSPDFP